MSRWPAPSGRGVRLSVAAMVGVSIGVAACAEADVSPLEAWTGTVDTLPGGAIHTSSPTRGLWAEGEGWRLVEDLRLGTLDVEGPELFGAVQDVEVDGMGRLWVLDYQANEVRVFDAAGGHVRTFGREGSGPGEFDTPADIFFAPDDRVWVLDLRNQRYEVFDSAGTRVDGFPVPIRFTSFNATFDSAGLLVEPFPDDDIEGRAYARRRIEPGLPAVDTFFAPSMGERMTVPVRFDIQGRSLSMEAPVPFAHQPGVEFQRDVSFWAYPGGDGYRFMRIEAEGDTTLVVERAFEPVPLTTSQREEASEISDAQVETSIPADLIPEHHPPFESISHLPDGHILVDRVVAPEEVHAWDVFDPLGRYLGQLDRPAGYESFRPYRYLDDAIVGTVRGDFDETYVVRLRIQRAG